MELRDKLSLIFLLFLCTIIGLSDDQYKLHLLYSQYVSRDGITWSRDGITENIVYEQILQNY